MMSSLSIDTHWPIAAHMHRCTIHFWWRISILFSKQWVTVKCYSWLEKHGCWITGQLLEIGETGKTCAEEIFVSVRATSDTTSGYQRLARTEMGMRTAHGTRERVSATWPPGASSVLSSPSPHLFPFKKSPRGLWLLLYLSARYAPHFVNEWRKKKRPSSSRLGHRLPWRRRRRRREAIMA